MKSIIDFANDMVPVTKALALVDSSFSHVDISFKGKLYCPFGHINHSDGGREKSLRLYSVTNSAFCFASCGFLNPVRLFSIAYDLKYKNAAYRVLEATGYKPLSLQERWDSVSTTEIQINKDDLQQALIVFCIKFVGVNIWKTVQYENDILTYLDKCFYLLSLVSSEEDAYSWLASSKEIMSSVLKNYG